MKDHVKKYIQAEIESLECQIAYNDLLLKGKMSSQDHARMMDDNNKLIAKLSALQDN